VGDLAIDTAVEQLDEGRFRANLSEDWRVWGPNGGYLAVIALRAAGAVSAQPRPASIAVHFLGVARFEPVDIDVTVLRATRRAQSLQVSMRQHGKPIVEAIAWAIADGLEPLEHAFGEMPVVPSPDSIPTLEERLGDQAHGFWRNVDNRSVGWSDEWPPPGPFDPSNQWWCRFRPTATFDDPWVDAGRSLLLVDTFGWPVASNAHAWRNVVDGVQQRFAPTIDVYASFHAFSPTAEWLLVDATSPAGADGLLGARLAVWSPDGRLLASGAQTMLVTPAAG
jgi:acyl-CoA thioesterase-2